MKGTELTASGIISFAQRLEEGLAEYYEELAERFPDQEEAFEWLARGSRKSKKLVTRTYQETITDALEACFSFEGLDLSGYAAEAEIGEGASYKEAVEKAIELEEGAREFYLEVAERSESLLATIVMAFRRAAKTRDKHVERLQSMLD